MAPIEERSTRVLAWAAIAVALVTGLGYVALIITGATDPVQRWTQTFVASYIFLMAGLLAASVVQRWSVARHVLRAAAAGGLLGLGVIGLFSIGLPLFVAGVLAAIATLQTLAGRGFELFAGSALVPAVFAIVVLLVLFETTQRMIVCPAQGTMGGGGTDLLTGPYHYECVDGILTYHSGG